MTADATATLDLQSEWLEKSHVSLQETYDCKFNFWTFTEESGWLTTDGEKPEELFAESSYINNDEEDNQWYLTDLLHQVRSEEVPGICKIASTQYVLAISITCPESYTNYIATSVFETDLPEQLLKMGKVSQCYFKQQEKITGLEQENHFFLHQVSEDFENLTFLRFMADRLSLGSGSNAIDEILEPLLRRLGEAIKTQTLCFIDGKNEAEPKIQAIWSDANQKANEVDPTELQNLIKHYRGDAKIQPVIKNAFEESLQFSGVRDFILVEVATSMTDIGWLLAVNRRPSDRAAASQFFWRLSQHEFGTNEASLLSTAAAMLASHASNLNLFQERETLLVNVVRALVSAVEAKDDYTCGHSERVALYAKRLAERIGYSDEECELLYLTGLLHDVGKIAVSDAVLNKPDALTEEEFEEIKQHPDEGWAILRELKQLSYVLPGVLHHHERYDGMGYPDGLAGQDIPRDGRVLAVADAFDAMTSNRAYRQGMPQKKAEEILKEGAGTQWDKEVIDAFFEVREELAEMRENYQQRERPVRKSDKQLLKK